MAEPPADATWHDHAKVGEYLGRVNRLEARIAGERALAELLPASPRSVLDLGCGDGKLAAVVLEACPSVERVVAVDASPPMLDAARERFAGDDRVTVVDADLNDSIGGWGSFDVIVSGFAIHHVEHDRKQSLFGEIARALEPGGLFANLEVVDLATPDLEAEFHRRIDRPSGDPEDRCAPVEDQLTWMRAAGLVEVDCLWKWWGFALLVGRR
jgi:ubiquinone/menaquinone biosynthesis C-methylase UbiE